MMSSGKSQVAFTASQWQELEHQALIFKYMASGMPIPPDLLYAIRRSCLASKLHHHHQPQHTIGWSCFQMGYGRKIDPDPGRCRRTDGKKWRCSKEAFPDSKYCERHMHRGRNRSRKPVEVIMTPPPPPTSTSTPPPPTTRLFSTKSSDLYSFASIKMDSINSSTSPFAFPHSSSSSRTSSGLGFSSQDNNNNFLLGSSHYSHAGKDYNRMKQVGEHTFLSEASGAMASVSSSSMDDSSWQLSMNAPLSHLNHKDSSKSYLQLFTIGENSSSRQHDYATKASYTSSSDDHQPQKKVMHRFFDEWPPPPKDKDSWIDCEDKLSISIGQSLSKTQLSISMPNPFT